MSTTFSTPLASVIKAMKIKIPANNNKPLMVDNATTSEFERVPRTNAIPTTPSNITTNKKSQAIWRRHRPSRISSPSSETSTSDILLKIFGTTLIIPPSQAVCAPGLRTGSDNGVAAGTDAYGLLPPSLRCAEPWTSVSGVESGFDFESA